jgi:hypothetical protein
MNPSAGTTQNVPNYLVQAILVTIFCCLPLGIVGIIFATQVNTKLAAGDYAGAVEASNKAKQWTMYGFIGGIVVTVLVILLNVLGIAAIGMSGAR